MSCKGCGGGDGAMRALPVFLGPVVDGAGVAMTYSGDDDAPRPAPPTFMAYLRYYAPAILLVLLALVVLRRR